MIAEAQRLGYAEADPSADVDGYDARSKLVLLAALAFGEKITPRTSSSKASAALRRSISSTPRR